MLQLPDITWVIFSLTKIPWGEYSSDWEGILKQFLAGPLNNIDTRKHLVENGILETPAQDKIIAVCQGIPIYLDLLLNIPVIDLDLLQAHTPDSIYSWILNKYLDELNPAEQQTLHLLASAGIWEEDLLDRLIITFSAHCYLPSFHELNRFPFILPGRLPGTRILHPIMQKHLQESGNYTLQQDIHQISFSPLCGSASSRVRRKYGPIEPIRV